MYKISIPLVNELITDENREQYLCELKSAKADRALLIPRGSFEDLSDAVERARSVKVNADILRENGIEPSIWIGTTIGHGGPLAGEIWDERTQKYAPLVNLAGDVLPDTHCPFGETFRTDLAKFIAIFAKYSGVKLIFLDDDYRLSQHGKEFCCACDAHMKRIREICGENISRDELKKLAFMSKANKYRDAWLTAQRESLELLARDIRAAVDEVDGDVCVALCAAHSIWGVDGSSATDISAILAGKNPPVTRLHPAPYWAIHSTMPLPTVFEIARMFADFSRGSGSELLAEGDTYPRPRTSTPSSYLELFDAVIRADGTYDGTLKYMIDYCSPVDNETGYVKRHVHNLPVMEKITEIFDGKEHCGVLVPTDKKVLEYADFETSDAFRNNYPLPSAGRMLAHLSIPTVYSGKGICTALFGENARKYPLELIDKGAILDAVSAKLLTERGVDVGLLSTPKLKISSAKLEHTKDGNYIVCIKRQEGRFATAELSDKCDVLLEATVDNLGKIPLIYRYENAEGQRFTVCMSDMMGNAHTSFVFRGYHIQSIISDAAEWIGGKKLPAKCPKNPDLYMICKKSADEKKMSVGLFNCYADSILEPVIKLDGEYSSVRFVGCDGRLEGDTVTLSAPINAFEFAAFEVVK